MRAFTSSISIRRLTRTISKIIQLTSRGITPSGNKCMRSTLLLSVKWKKGSHLKHYHTWLHDSVISQLLLAVVQGLLYEEILFSKWRILLRNVLEHHSPCTTVQNTFVDVSDRCYSNNINNILFWPLLMFLTVVIGHIGRWDLLSLLGRQLV